MKNNKPHEADKIRRNYKVKQIKQFKINKGS